jgi:hypothetical protein
LRSLAALLLSDSGLPRDAPSQLCNIAHPTNVFRQQFLS